MGGAGGFAGAVENMAHAADSTAGRKEVLTNRGV
jgi:hypothetical protein